MKFIIDQLTTGQPIDIYSDVILNHLFTRNWAKQKTVSLSVIMYILNDCFELLFNKYYRCIGFPTF